MDSSLQYPIPQIRDFSELLVVFERALNSVLLGETALAVQLRDVPVFRRIKQKIENLPYLKELFFPKTSKSATVVRSLGRANASEIPGLARDSKPTKGVGSSVEFSLASSHRDKLLGSGSRHLPPIKPFEISVFAPDDEPTVALADVLTALTGAIDESERQVGMVRKLKLALFQSQPQSSVSAQCLYKYLMFALFGSSDPKLLLTSKQSGKQDSGSCLLPSERCHHCLDERAAGRQVSQPPAAGCERKTRTHFGHQSHPHRTHQQSGRE